ncbi:MAG: TetR/AcrR family transcriptional regulator [Sedimentibacter sp.]|uniref:TetR/AcrR family transcriptional regulator n=1 Tax=Sedimentibacter sp. TaxID=1960295 RepID=UPI0031591370
MAEYNQKRKDILTSARSLFREKGFHNTKIEEIAAKAGVGKGTVYEYFTSKQEIFDETCIDKVAVIHDSLEEINSRNISFREKIEEMLSMKETNTEFAEASVDGVMTNKNIISKKVVLAMMNHVDDMYKIIVKMIDQGKEEGSVSKDVSSELIACLIVGASGEFVRFRHLNGRTVPMDKKTIINLLFNGFGVK